jgi:hypothetical protein
MPATLVTGEERWLRYPQADTNRHASFPGARFAIDQRGFHGFLEVEEIEFLGRSALEGSLDELKKCTIGSLLESPYTGHRAILGAFKERI